MVSMGENTTKMIPHDVVNNVASSSSSSIQLFANFDSGNMLRYERVTSTMSSSQLPTNTAEADSNNNSNNPNAETVPNSISHPLPKHDVEFNVWTRRDCEGTAKVNGNRSWFYFGVKGGYGKCLRFNIMNLNRQARLFEMGMLPVFRTIPGHEKWVRLHIRPCWETVNEDFKLSFIHRITDSKNSVTYFAFCFPHSYDDMQTLLKTYDSLYSDQLADHYLEQNLLPINSSDIYYHRETLCYSCDGNKIDLLTITSYKGITEEREHHFDKRLFPDVTTKRPHQFRNKRVYFLSSRVHPGETPAAFVFLGFLDFILKSDDPRAKLLRDLYIFKLIPILNPDGVQRGHYRTDQFGVNLNRMYLDPDFDKHPSIYAAKSVMAYHHVNNCTSQRPALTIYDVFKDVMAPEQSKPSIQDNDPLGYEGQFQGKTTPRLRQFPPTLSYMSPMPTTPRPQHHVFDEASLEERSTPEENRPFFLERKENGLNPKLTINTDDDDDEIRHTSPYAFHYFNENLEIRPDLFLIDNEGDDDEDEGNLRQQMRGNEGSDDEDDGFLAGQNNQENGAPEPKSPHLFNPDLLKISPYESGLAYYIDLHGHASKKGCFIYGNHLPDDEQHTDNLLFPKLISLNSQHFDFENCNFTIKNMYMKDKREGLSKEGSGRVALNKHLGILHSYTLECSYAVGKCCNPIAAAESETHGGRISPPIPFALPPKFAIEHYRDVGKACALAAIDVLPGRNPFTRVSQSTFKNLQTLRDFLRHQVRQQRNRMGNARTMPNTVPATVPSTNRAKQQQYMARVSQTYRTVANMNNLATVTQQQQQMTSSFPATSSAPPGTTATRVVSNSQFTRILTSNANQASAQRGKAAFESRRSSNVATPYKRAPPAPITSNPRNASILSRIEIVPLPATHIGLQQQIASPGRLQRQPPLSPSSSQYVLPATALLDPPLMGRNRAVPLRPANIRNAIHRNAISLNALAMNNQNGPTARGRSQNSASKGASSTRIARIRQQSLATSDLQPPNLPYSSATVIYRHPMNPDPPPVFFE